MINVIMINIISRYEIRLSLMREELWILFERLLCINKNSRAGNYSSGKPEI